MAQSSAITTLFLDIGNVLLTDSWSPSLQQQATEKFDFDFAEVSERSRLIFEAYEEGRVSLDEYLDWGVFYQARPFTREALRRAT